MISANNVILSILGSGLIIIMGCDYQISKPEDKTEKASMRIEYDYQNGYDMYTILGEELFQYVADSYSKVGMKLRFLKDDTYILPQYPGTGYFPDNEIYLRDYAETNLNHGYVWHLLYVSRYASNIGGGANQYGRSSSLNNGYNLPPSPANRRYSYLWWQDIIEEVPNQNNQKKVGVFVTVHELAHQRAGLSDYQVEQIYHNPIFDFNGDQQHDCVMNYYAGNYSLTPIFCYDTDANDQTPDNSCKENISANYGNF